MGLVGAGAGRIRVGSRAICVGLARICAGSRARYVGISLFPAQFFLLSASCLSYALLPTFILYFPPVIRHSLSVIRHSLLRISAPAPNFTAHSPEKPVIDSNNTKKP